MLSSPPLSPRPLLALVLALAVLPSFLGGSLAAHQNGERFTVSWSDGGEAVAAGTEITFAVVEPLAGATYIWAFGDGSPPKTGSRVLHTYTAVDDYRVVLDVVIGRTQERLGERLLRVVPAVLGVFTADSDGQITPADLFHLAVMVYTPGLASLTVRLSGPLVVVRSDSFLLPGEVAWLLFPDTRVRDERDPFIAEEIVHRPGAAVPFAGHLMLTLEWQTSAGRTASVVLAPEVYDFNQPERAATLTYPRAVDFVGLPPEGPGDDGYYLLGDPDFSHSNDPYVRRLALEWGRRGGPWPDNPHTIASNIFHMIDALLGDGDPGQINNDYNFARLFADGTLSTTRSNGPYICIAQAYLFTSLARTLGIPAREINNAIGAPGRQRSDGVWTVVWWQEAGLELWYDGAWHYFDTWLGVTSRRAYLDTNLIYQAWAAFNRQDTEFRTIHGQGIGLRGHDFGAWPGDPPQWRFIEEGVRPGIRVEGMSGGPPAAVISGLPWVRGE